MNKRDREILEMNWELQKENFKNSKYKHDMDISSSCYVSFGICGIAVMKYFRGKWHRKTVNGWKELSFKQFLEKFNEQEWEEI